MKTIILLIVSLLLTNSETEFNKIKGVIVKKHAFQINTYKHENMYQFDYLLKVPFQYNIYTGKDLKLLDRKGWVLCESESFDWQEFKDISGNKPKWISNKSIVFYKGKSNRLILVLMYEASSKLEVRVSKIQKIVISIIHLSKTQIQQVEKAGYFTSCNRNERD